MAEILHRVVIKDSPRKVFQAITEQTGLASWWTTMVDTTAKKDSIAKFRFGNGSMGPDMKITEIEPDKRVVWECVAGPWVNTTFSFDIAPHEKGAVINFANRGWPEASEFYMHCNCKWGFFLGVSLKNYVEKGKGSPHPDDPDL